MITPQKFSKSTGISYNQVLKMCKSGELETVKSEGGYYKIFDYELDKFLIKKDFISRESYESVLRENERLKTTIRQLKIAINGIELTE